MKKRILTLAILTQFLAMGAAHAQIQNHKHLHHHRHHSHPNIVFDQHSPHVQSNVALIIDESTQQVIYDKNADLVAPIASITKLMTAMVILDAKLPMDDEIDVSDQDKDVLKHSHSRLHVGMTFSRAEMLKMALMASENRAASALARSYPGGTVAEVVAMNEKAKQLGMLNTKFYDPTGLNSENVSTARDLAKMVAAAGTYPLIHQYTTTASTYVDSSGGSQLQFHNTDPLVRTASWHIGLSKTGFINEAGHCLVLQANIKDRPVIIVLLDSWGRQTRIGDANRIRRWMESSNVVARMMRTS